MNTLILVIRLKTEGIMVQWVVHILRMIICFFATVFQDICMLIGTSRVENSEACSCSSNYSPDNNKEGHPVFKHWEVNEICTSCPKADV